MHLIQHSTVVHSSVSVSTARTSVRTSGVHAYTRESDSTAGTGTGTASWLEEITKGEGVGDGIGWVCTYVRAASLKKAWGVGRSGDTAPTAGSRHTPATLTLPTGLPLHHIYFHSTRVSPTFFIASAHEYQ